MKPKEIRDLRREKKLTQDQLGELCGVGKSAVSNWEKGTTTPSGSALLILQRLKSGETVISELSDLEVKLLDQNVSIGKFKDREDYLTASLKHLLQFGRFLSLAESAKLAKFPGTDHLPDTGKLVAFPAVPLLRAAAGFPILADAEHVEPDRDLGEGRFLLELRGDSMEPRFQNKQRVVLRDKASLKRPVLKYGEIYCFVHDGAATFKQWAKDESGRKVLRSLNQEYADIPADEETDWIGWMDEKDNPGTLEQP